MIEIIVRFHGRKSGAIGIFHPVELQMPAALDPEVAGENLPWIKEAHRLGYEVNHLIGVRPAEDGSI